MGRQKLRIIPDKLFSSIYLTSFEGYSKQEHQDLFLSYKSSKKIDFWRKYRIGEYEAATLINAIYDLANLSFNDLIIKTGKKKCEIRDIFCIPQRTLENWCYGKQPDNHAIRLMIIKQYHLLNLGNYIKLESELEYEDTKPKIYKKNNIKTESDTKTQLDFSNDKIIGFLNDTEENYHDFIDDDKNRSPALNDKEELIQKINQSKKTKNILLAMEKQSVEDNMEQTNFNGLNVKSESKNRLSTYYNENNDDFKNENSKNTEIDANKEDLSAGEKYTEMSDDDFLLFLDSVIDKKDKDRKKKVKPNTEKKDDYQKYMDHLDSIIHRK